MTKYSILLTILLLFGGNLFLHAQVGINPDGGDPDASAMLDIESTDKGVLIPRMTTAQRTTISNPATGLLVFDSSQNTFFFYDGTAWAALSSGATSTVLDADADTRIQVEESTDEDIIRIDIGGVEKAVFDRGSTGYGRLSFQNNRNTILIGQNTGSQLSSGGVSGQFNTFLGDDVAPTSSGSTYNTYVGYQSGYSDLAAYDNAFFGYRAGYSTLSGSSNSYFGHRAGYNATGSGNVFIGKSAGHNETGNNRLYIENSNSATPLLYGEFDNNLLRINGTFDINNAFRFPTVGGAEGEVLKLDDSGNLLWAVDADTDQQALGLTGGMLSLTNGGTVDLNGYLDNTDSQDLTLSGNTLSLSGDNTSVDLSAYAADNLGNHIVRQNLELNNKWLSNDGSDTGISLDDDGTVSINGQFTGVSLAVQQKDDATETIFAAVDEAGSVVFGIADDKVVLARPLYTFSNWISGDGDEEGIQITGDGKVAFSDNLKTNNNWISNDGGNEGIYVRSNGDVGIGTNSADTRLYVRDDVTGIENFMTTIENTGGDNSNNARNEGLEVIAGHASYNSGQQSSFLQFTSPDGNYCGRIRQDANASVGYVDASDRRLKENIRPTAYSLADLMGIEVVDYNYKTDRAEDVQTGYIAQQIHTAFPAAVDVGDEDTYWGVDYGAVSPLLVKGVQELTRRVEALEKENAELRRQAAEIAELKKQFAELIDR